MLRYTLLLLALLAGALDATAANVLLVTGAGTLTSDESARRTQFQTWGHTVTTIVDSDTQTNFNTAMAAVDVVYIPMTVQEWEVGTKVKTTTKGVVCEERYLDIEMGFSTADGWDAGHTQTEILINSHSVTTGLSTGYVTIVSSSQSLCMMNPTVAGGMTILSKQNYGAGNMLGVIDVGGALAGGGTAAGRRVRMPWGGDSFAWSALNASGLKIAQQAIAWAVGDQGPRLWWKLDETSGSTVNDASGNNYHGTFTGTKTWVNGRRNGGVDIVSGAKASVSNLLGKPTNFTIAAWVNCDSVGSTGGVAVSVGDNLALIMDEPSANGGKPAVAFNYSGSNYRWATGGTSAAGKGWRHYVGVFDDAANTLKLYIDGVLVGTTSTTSSIDWVTTIGTTTAVGGTSYPVASYNLDGRVDDVRVYGRALSEAEIAEVYGLIAHWKLNESSGATADDSSLANNDATRTGTAGWTTGKDANGHNFNYNDGDDYFQAPTNTALNDVQEGDYTVMAYFKPNSVPPGSGSANNSAYAIVRKSGWHAGLVYGSDGSIFFEHWLQSGPTWNGAGDWDFHAPNSFYHVAGVVSRTEGTIKIYVDGVLKETSTFTPGAAPYDYGSTPWRIGISNPGASEWSHPADGVIDDARIYNRALADDEIAQFAGYRHWRFDESAGVVAEDSSPAAEDGAYVNGPALAQPAVLQTGASFNKSDTNDYLKLPYKAIDGATQVSVAWWMKSEKTGEQAILSGNRTSQDNAFLLFFNNHQLFQLYVDGSILGWNIEPISDGRWRHCILTYNGATRACQLYMDGALVSAKTHPKSATIKIDPNGLVSAQEQDSVGGGFNPSQAFVGSLDDLRVYRHVLSAAEVAEVYGLVGRWKLDESSGTTAFDTSGKGRHGTYLGSPNLAQQGPGSGALAAGFDGDDDCVTLPTIDDSFANGVTLAGWMRPTAPNNFAKLMQLSAGTSLAIDLGRLGTSNDLRGIVDNGSEFAMSGGLHSNVWRHYTMTIDSTGNMRLYRNGALLGAAARSPVPVAVRTTNWIGASNFGGDELFEGQMHDVRLYNRPISDAEATALYLGGNVFPSVRIVKWVEVANP